MRKSCPLGMCSALNIDCLHSNCPFCALCLGHIQSVPDHSWFILQVALYKITAEHLRSLVCMFSRR